MTINRSKGFLSTLESTHNGSASVAPIKAYITSEVKDLECPPNFLVFSYVIPSGHYASNCSINREIFVVRKEIKY
jgi:hypothetical protein